MIFKAFDMEKQPESQGFVEGSYDLILASKVLHATGTLEEMMINVRRLLKPGGYLVALELTSNDTLRVGLPMGSLPGWWVGADTGRPWGPTLSLPQWHSLLRKCGFGGIETSTPLFHKLHPSSVFAAQAVDDRINLLRTPLSSITALPPTDAPRLIIVGGETLAAHRLAERLESHLSHRFNYIERVDSFESLDGDILLQGSTVLSITELDEPIFKNITPGKLQALQTLWRAGTNVLWVTRGARSDEPYSFMTHGLGRVVKFEYPNISLEVFDLDTIDERAAQLIVEEMLRLEVLKKWEREAVPGEELLWSIEPEVYIENGVRIIPRLYQCEPANDRYNTSRRAVTAVVDPQESSVLISSNGTTYEVHYPSPLRQPSPLPALGLTTDLQVSHFLLQSIKVASFGKLALCLGIDKRINEQVLALTHSTESRIEVLTDWTVPLRGVGDPIEALVSVAAEITASNILNLAGEGSTIVVHEPDNFVAFALSSQSSHKSIRVTFTTSLKEKAQADNTWCYIHAKASQRLIERALPVSSSVFVNLSQAPSSSIVGQLIARCLPRSCAIYNSQDFFGTGPMITLVDSFAEVSKAMKEASASVLDTSSYVGSPTVIQLQEISSFTVLETPLTAVNCSASGALANVQAIDEGTIFRRDKTYLMVGMSDQVGQSLCQWMVARGAKHVVLTSRRPKVHPEFIKTVEAWAPPSKSCHLTSQAKTPYSSAMRRSRPQFLQLQALRRELWYWKTPCLTECLLRPSPRFSIRKSLAPSY